MYFLHLVQLQLYILVHYWLHYIDVQVSVGEIECSTTIYC